MTAIDYETEYNNRVRLPEHLDILARWRAVSAVDRQVARAALDQAYGPGERHRYDLYSAGEPAAPLIVYLHGGYWQMGSRQDTAFIARAFNAAGIDVAVASYSLCPAVTVLDIIDEIRRCLAAVWSATGKRPVVVGHSAGGHLAAAMLATDWQRRPGVPADLVRASCAISGVFELTPLISTTMNQALRLAEDSAAAASPARWAPPPAGHALLCAVGGDETGEFHRQSQSMAAGWAAAGVATEYVSIPGVNHFTIVDELTRPDSELFGRVTSLIRRSHR